MARRSNRLRVVNNDGSYDKDKPCIIKGCGLHWGITLTEMKILHEQLGKKLLKLTPQPCDDGELIPDPNHVPTPRKAPVLDFIDQLLPTE
jgi:hypothetical protein